MQCYEQRDISLFWMCIFRSPNLVSVKICQSLRRNKKQRDISVRYEWSLLANGDISNLYTVTERNKFDTLQVTPERLTPNDEYVNFVSGHLETASECKLPTLKAKSSGSWQLKAVMKK